MSAGNVVPAGQFPTAYGVSVPVMRNAAAPAGADGRFVFSAASAAVMAGIHDSIMRFSYVDEVRRGGNAVELLHRYGGRPVLRLPLEVPDRFTYHAAPTRRSRGDTTGDHGVRDLLDETVTWMTDIPHWASRSEEMIRFFHHQAQALKGMSAAEKAHGLSLILTGLLEHLGETEIQCLEAAAFYSLTLHPAWRKAGRDWLLPVRRTWLADWLAERQPYRRLAKMISHGEFDVPSWLQRPEHRS